MENIIEFRNSLRNVKNFDPEIIVNKYKEFTKRNEVFRFKSKDSNHLKTFGLKDRTGIYSPKDETKVSNRKEEFLCQSLFNTYKYGSDALLRIPSYSQYIIDYQTPLSNNGKDNSWGDIDLLGIIQKSPKKKLCFWEIKYGENNDSIYYAIMELLIYFSQFDMINSGENISYSTENYRNLLIETEFVRLSSIPNNIIEINSDYTPVLFIAADEAYFNKHKWNDKKREYMELKNVIEKELHISIEFVKIDGKFHYKNNRYIYDKEKELKLLK